MTAKPTIPAGPKAALDAAATQTEYHRAIDLVTSFIHSHSESELPLERLAQLAGFSPFHFHRIFAALMGETLPAYVRRWRLRSNGCFIRPRR